MIMTKIPMVWLEHSCCIEDDDNHGNIMITMMMVIIVGIMMMMMTKIPMVLLSQWLQHSNVCFASNFESNYFTNYATHPHHHHGYPAYSHHDKIPPWWEYVSNDKGGNMSVTKSHHTWKILLGVCMFQSIPYNNGQLPNVQFSNWCPWGQICSLLYNSTPSRTLPWSNNIH